MVQKVSAPERNAHSGQPLGERAGATRQREPVCLPHPGAQWMGRNDPHWAITGGWGRLVTYAFYRWSCPDFLSALPSSVFADGSAALACPLNVAGSWDVVLDLFSQLTVVPLGQW